MKKYNYWFTPVAVFFFSGKQCKLCEKGWLYNRPSCYLVQNPKKEDWKTWDEAQAECKTKMSDLVVITNEEEKVRRKLRIFMT